MNIESRKAGYQTLREDLKFSISYKYFKINKYLL